MAKYKDGMKTFIQLVIGRYHNHGAVAGDDEMYGRVHDAWDTCDLFLKRRQIFWAFNVHGPCEC